MSDFTAAVLPFSSRPLANGCHVVVSMTGDHAFLSSADLQLLRHSPQRFPLEQLSRLRARFLVGTQAGQPGLRRLVQSRIAARRETVSSGPALHIIVPTLQCAHSCKYCQVSRSLEDTGHTMTAADLDTACDTIFDSPAPALTVEFQGGDPLLRFDLIQRAVLRISKHNQTSRRQLRFVVASTLHQLTEEMCSFFREHRVFLSTSLDGPAELHNRNRPTPTRDSYQRTLAGIEMARRCVGEDAVSALMTTTRASLAQPEAIVDEYVRHGLQDIFIRPLSAYGFAKRNQAHLGYSLEDFQAFYTRALERVLHWNRQGVELRDVYASIILNKVLSPFDSGYVDLQSPTGAGSSVLVYNYDGYVYPSDEARMLMETGDSSLRLGRIGAPLEDLLKSPVRQNLVKASQVEDVEGCRQCPYRLFCAPNPIDAHAQFGTMFAPVQQTEHCRRHLWMFDSMFERLASADDWTLDLFHRWACPAQSVH